LFGDENNANPKVAGYVVVNANTSYRINRNFEVFAMVQNLFDRNYETFGTFSATDEVPLMQAPNAANPRALSAAPPIALYGGVRFKF
jgi:outer membrane receptor protein involved in Fe transport